MFAPEVTVADLVEEKVGTALILEKVNSASDFEEEGTAPLIYTCIAVHFSTTSLQMGHSDSCVSKQS